MTGRRLMFWGGVAGVSVLSSFGLALIAARVNSPGLNRFRQFTYSTTSA